MPAPGSVWLEGTWHDDAFAADTWADAVIPDVEAGPIGSVWASGTWEEVWAEGSWATAVIPEEEEPEAPEVEVTLYAGKYGDEHAGAFADLAAAHGFGADHAGALAGIGGARGFSAEHRSARADLAGAGLP